MGTSLSAQMLTAYDKYDSQIELLLRQCGINSSLTDRDDLHTKVRNRFFLGVHTAFQKAILKALTKELGTQQQVAEVLGLKDRTSISQMIRSGTIEGIRLTAALYQYNHLIRLPEPELAAAYGFARATSFLKALAHDDEAIEGSMSPGDFSLLMGVLANKEWEAALRSQDPQPVRELAARVVRERTIDDDSTQDDDNKCRPEQRVLMLQALRLRWGDFAAISLCIIPECIPDDEANEEATA